MLTKNIGTTNAGTTPGGQAHGAVRPATAETPSRNVRAVAVWVGIGFIACAVFCTALGFWQSRPVTEGAIAPTVPALKSATLISPAASALPSIYLVDPANCSALQLNRETNSTELRPCPSTGLALRLDPETPREDMAGVLSTTAQASAYDGN
jgi:hypothetical protein